MSQAQSTLKSLESAAKELAAALKVPAPRGAQEREALCSGARWVIDSPDLHGIPVGSDQWRTQAEQLRTLLDAGLGLARIHAEFDQALTPEAWEQDLADTGRILSDRGSKWSRRFSAEYRRADRRLSSLLRPPKPSQVERRLQLIGAVTQARHQRDLINQSRSLGEALFAHQWQARNSNWEALSQLTDWVQGLHQSIEQGKVPAGIIDFLNEPAEQPLLDQLRPLLKAVEDAAQAHSSTAQIIRAGLEAARKDLLDLGLRNPLLNYHLLRTRGLEVVDESPVQVHRILVDEGRSMSFLPITEEGPGDILSQPVETVEAEEPEARHTATKLQTALSSQELQARLLSTYHLANSFTQEQGVNTLFLALGMLNWHESQGGQDVRRAPLVLLPVALERASVRDRFRIRHTGEEPGHNLSLLEKARADFGLTLPGLPDTEDVDIGAYFDSIDEVVNVLPRWSVDRESIVLGFFSFSTFLMYRDLDAANWPDSAAPTEHPIVGALMHQGFDEPAPTISDDEQLDQHLPPNQVHHVVDADGSQTLVLIDVNDGRNLVVQGPPGTGKSQTIANMIAEAMGRGRTVLFVSEKMAALEVVKRRLDAVGLGDACLELHSRKTTKKAVLEELQRTLDLGRPRLGQIDADFDSLVQLRQRLNSYCEAVNVPIGESGVNPYQAYGELALLNQRTAELGAPRLDFPSISEWSESEFRRKEEMVRELQARLTTIGVPQDHLFWGSRLRTLLPADEQRLQETLPPARESLTELVNTSADLAAALDLPKPAGQAQAGALCLAARRVMDAPDLTGLALRAEEWRTCTQELSSLLNAGSELSRLRQEFDHVLIPGAWNQDLNALNALKESLDTNGRKWWRLLSGEYRQTKRNLTDLCIGSPPHGVDAQLQLVGAVLESEDLRPIVAQGFTLGQTLFGDRWQGEGSDWPVLSSLAEWIGLLFDDMQAGGLPEGIIGILADNPVGEDLEPHCAAVEAARQAHAGTIKTVTDIIDLDEDKRFGAECGFCEGTFDVQQQMLQAWGERTSEIHDIVGFNNISDSCRSEGLDSALATAAWWPQAGSYLLDTFRQAWFEGLAARVMTEREALTGFDGNGHQQAVERFREMDSQALQHNRARLARSHWEKLPRQEGRGQLGILKREFQKRRRHLAIRQLMGQAGNAVQAVKPVFMMSPLSIATFVPPGSLAFDLVIFDEASQVRPVEALGAILRAGQAVVVGDSKQLPPTSFFDSATQGNEEDDDNVTADIESILGLFAAQSASTRMLKWHYRSRHESLIAISNREFYNNQLVVFPSPDAERQDAGLKYHLLPDTVYDRGQSRTNQEEAVAVARAVMSHADDHPELTLGVAAFSVAQMRAILDQVERLRREDPSQEAFFAGHTHEPFFVKNLETVQGDERDVIFISVGYGHDAQGRVDLNFGPLNWEGGERRLNVLITRARIRCEVFTNLTAADIDSSRTVAPGLAALKAFLEYAAAGTESGQPASSDEAVPPFQQAVAVALAGLGYDLHHQVGVAGHSVDIAVVDPDSPGRYLLGIECDGPTYFSSKSARDRDRLRQQVLHRLGWRLHRIWSTDWFHNPERELQRIGQSIEQASAGQAAVERDSRLSLPVQRDGGVQGDDDGTVVAEYRLAKPKIAAQGQEFLNAPDTSVALWVAEIVEAESPIHSSEVTRRIADAASARKSKRFQEVVQQAIEDSLGSGRVRREGEFLWWGDTEEPVLRSRSKLPASSRNIELVAPQEIALAVTKAVAGSYGIGAQDAPAAVARLLGLAGATSEVRTTVEPIIRRLIADGVLTQSGNQLEVADDVDA